MMTPRMADTNRVSGNPRLVVGVGASAGGVEAITELARCLPADLDAAVVVVLHISASGTSLLPKIVGRATDMRVCEAENGAALASGTIYVAPSDCHVLIRRGKIMLSHGPKVNGHRPAVDPTFEAIAQEYGSAGVGVILSGTLDDGSRGAYEIESAGGRVLLQDPTEARHSGMISSARRYTHTTVTYPVARLADELVRLTEREPEIHEPAETPGSDERKTTSATRYTCPDCGGVLWRQSSGPSLRYSCSIGHEYSPASLDQAQGRDVEAALWAAVRILGDRETLLTELADSAAAGGRTIGEGHFRGTAAEMSTAAAVIRELIERGGFDGVVDPDETGGRAA